MSAVSLTALNREYVLLEMRSTFKNDLLLATHTDFVLDNQLMMRARGITFGQIVSFLVFQIINTIDLFPYLNIKDPHIYFQQ